MKLLDNRRFILILLALLIGCMTIALIRAVVSREKELKSVSKPQLQKLPDDVEMVLKKYEFRETDDGMEIEISGNQIVHRGREILGLRSNLVKATYFQNIRGKLNSTKGKIEFSAKDAEWDTTSSSPLLLRRNVSVSINNKQLADVKNARIYLKQGVMEVTGDQKMVIRIK